MTDINDYMPSSGRRIAENNDIVNVIESLTKSYKTTESDHSLNHVGMGYKAYIDIVNLASGQSLSWCLKGPSTLFAHIKNFTLCSLGSSAKVEILRGANVTVNNGTSVQFINTNDNSNNVAQSTIKANPTYTGGTMWASAQVLIDSTNQNVGSVTSNSGVYEEIITKSGDTNYIIKITNIGSDNLQRGCFTVFMYEEEKGIINHQT